MIVFFQYLGMICIWLILRIFSKLEIIGRENLKDLEKPLIIVSNHESHLDPPLRGHKQDSMFIVVSITIGTTSATLPITIRQKHLS